MYQVNIKTPPPENGISVQEIYYQFLNKINYVPICLYKKNINVKKNGKLVKKMVPQLQLEEETLNISLSLCLQGLVMWKDNLIHREEVRMSKLSFTMLKHCFPKDNLYDELAMNKHLSDFLTFLLSDFRFTYLPKILQYFYENSLLINRSEMKLQLEMVSKVDGLEDPREQDIIYDVLACLYDKKISVDKLIINLKKGIDFNALKRSAEKFPELKVFLN